MLKRIITAVVMLCVFIPVIIFSDTLVFPIAVALCTCIAAFEMLRCMGLHKNLVLCLPLYASALAFPMLVRLVSDAGVVAAIAFVVAVAYLVIMFAMIVWSHGKLKFADGSSVFAIVLYIIAAFCGIIYVRDLPGGEYIYLLIFVGAWITDVFAYFTGMLLGKHKLIPDVSPKKTIEGSIGGIVFCTLSFVGYGLAIDAMFDIHISIIFLLVSGIIVSIVSQVGDLIMSVIKRHYEVKDYGRIFPGHGGMLDRFDSVLIVSICMLAICLAAKLMGFEFVATLS